MVTFGNTKVQNIVDTNEVKSKSKSSVGDKDTYRTEFFNSDNDDERQRMLDKLSINTKSNLEEFNKKPTKISPKSLRKLNTNDYYIKLLECSTHKSILEKLNVFQIASIYMKNTNNIFKLDKGDKCVLSYINSVFANIQHKGLLTRLKISIEIYLKTINSYSILNLYNKPQMISPRQVFVKRHNPPPLNIKSIKIS